MCYAHILVTVTRGASIRDAGECGSRIWGELNEWIAHRNINVESFRERGRYT